MWTPSRHAIQTRPLKIADSSDYDGFWQAVMPDLHRTSFDFWTSKKVSQAARRETMKARFGLTWTMNKAFKWHTSYMPGWPVALSANCPLCQGADCIGHLLGECKHPVMKSLIIERHNAAARMILKAVHGGSLGACQTIADVAPKTSWTTWRPKEPGYQRACCRTLTCQRDPSNAPSSGPTSFSSSRSLALRARLRQARSWRLSCDQHRRQDHLDHRGGLLLGHALPREAAAEDGAA